MQPFTRKVVDIIRSIPEGRVMTYGQIAEMAGNRRGARQVVRVLHTYSKSQSLPWHRVINAKGQIAITDEEARYEQRLALESEGIVVDANGYIELDRWRHYPSEIITEDEFLC